MGSSREGKNLLLKLCKSCSETTTLKSLRVQTDCDLMFKIVALQSVLIFCVPVAARKESKQGKKRKSLS